MNSDQELLQSCIKLAKIIYEGKFKTNGEPWIASPRRVAEVAQLRKWPIEIVCACWFKDIYDADPAHFQYTLEDIAGINQKVAQIVKTISKPHDQSDDSFFYHVSQSPDGKAIVWLSLLDYLATTNDPRNGNLNIHRLESMYPDHMV